MYRTRSVRDRRQDHVAEGVDDTPIVDRDDGSVVTLRDRQQQLLAMRPLPAEQGVVEMFSRTHHYDQAVMQVLLVLKHYLGDAIIVTSDGDFAVEWAEARRTLQHRYGIRTVDGQRLERAAV